MDAPRGIEVEGTWADSDAELWLRTSEGFLVDDEDGTEIGVVDEVEVGTDGHVRALVAACGWFGRRRCRIKVDDIRTIFPFERRIVARRT